MKRRVAVTGMAVVSPLGCSVEDFWNGVTGGAVGTGPVRRFSTERYGSRPGGEVAGFIAPGDLPDAPLVVQYAVTAVRDALNDAAATPTRTGLSLGTVMGTRPLVDSWRVAPFPVPERATRHESTELGAAVARAAGLGGPVSVVSTGCAAGNDAIGYAAGLVARGSADRMVAGGAEELSEAVFALFASLRALTPDLVRPFDAARKGIAPSEGAAALVLEPLEDARARGVPVYAEILAHASAADAYHHTAPHPEGLGLRECLGTALARAGLEHVDYVNAHGTGTPANDGIEARAVTRLFDGRTVPAISSIKGALGHAQGAASALEAVACVCAIREGLLPGMPTLREVDPGCAHADLVRDTRKAQVDTAASLAFGFGGSVSTLIFAAAARQSPVELRRVALKRTPQSATRRNSTVGVVARGRVRLDEVGVVRLRRYLTRHAELFLCAGVGAARGAGLDIPADPTGFAVVCGTRTAGMSEYEALLAAGSPVAAVFGTQSSFNSPASHLSIHLGTRGPCITLAGGPGEVMAYANHILATEQAHTVLAGIVEAGEEHDAVPDQGAASVVVMAVKAEPGLLAALLEKAVSADERG